MNAARRHAPVNMPARRPPALELSVDWAESARLPLGRTETRRLFSALARRLAPLAHATPGLPIRLSLLIAGDAELAACNRDHAGLRGPTNALAFPDDFSPGSGDLALSADAVIREAALHNQSVPLHLARLLAHSLLHLFGMDHGPDMRETTESAAREALKAVDAPDDRGALARASVRREASA